MTQWKKCFLTKSKKNEKQCLPGFITSVTLVIWKAMGFICSLESQVDTERLCTEKVPNSAGCTKYF